jgi:ABC-type multidrug transport system fused ATPase/permease subunit
MEAGVARSSTRSSPSRRTRASCPAPALRDELAFDDILFAYEDERWIIHDVNVNIEAGQMVRSSAIPAQARAR